jgi:hypothetical protein
MNCTFKLVRKILLEFTYPDPDSQQKLGLHHRLLCGAFMKVSYRVSTFKYLGGSGILKPLASIIVHGHSAFNRHLSIILFDTVKGD